MTAQRHHKIAALLRRTSQVYPADTIRQQAAKRKPVPLLVDGMKREKAKVYD